MFRKFWWWLMDRCIKCGSRPYMDHSGKTIGCRYCRNDNCRVIYYLTCLKHGREGMRNKTVIQ